MIPEAAEQKWAKIALHFLVFAALAGIGLRYYNFSMISGLNYKYLLHAHSHIALLGWMFLAFSVALIKEFLGNDYAPFKNILILILTSVIGMMLSFPFQGYGIVSITFSTLFLIASYWFVIVFYKQLKNIGDRSIAAKWLRWALFFLVISSIGPWSLGPIMVFGESHGILYNLAIYYYLHFLYNGFFVLAVFGVILKHLDNLGLKYNIQRAQLFFQLTVYAVLPTYALSMLWISPPGWVYLLGGFASLSQVLAFIIAWPIVGQFLRSLKTKFIKVLFGFVLVAYGLKELMQFLSAMPLFADFAYETRVFTAIGYIHLVMLGFLSLFILIYFVDNMVFNDVKISRLGLLVFLIGILLSEAILFANGISLSLAGSYINNYSLLIMVASSLMPIGLIAFWAAQLSGKVTES